MVKFNDLIKSHHWESIKLILLRLYPDQTKGIDAYEKVYKNLQKTDASDSEMEIVLTSYPGDKEDEPSYIDVSGRDSLDIQNGITDNFFAIELVPWHEWLGMDINEKTLTDFTELEIIVHCLWEMTFYGYNEEEIQGFISKIEGRMEDYKANKKY